ncbi:MAG: amidohydrolase family protein [Rhodobacter sp.]|nr:amidohydrolase family protein [Rhodobacter sp.]
MTTLRAAAHWARPWTAPPRWGGQVKLVDGRVSEVVEASPEGDSVLIPGLVNAHDHGRGVRSLSFGASDEPLEAWLWGLRRGPMTDPYLTALVAFGRMALSGVTTVVHNHLPQSDDWLGEAKAVARAARDVGVRLGFVVPILDQNLAGYDGGAAVKSAISGKHWNSIEATMGQRPFAEQIDLVTEIGAAIDGPSVVTQYGPPGPQWLSRSGFAAVGEAADAQTRRVHVHLLETRLQRDWMDTACPAGAHTFFDRIGLLNDRLTIAHGVFLRDAELAAFRRAGVTLALNTSSNLRLFSGTADGAALRASGISLGIGLDGMAFDDDADILRELRLAATVLGPRGPDPAGLARADVLRAAYSGGWRAYNGTVGEGIVAGAEADMVALSLSAVAGDRIDGAPEALGDMITGRATKAAVTDVWVAGRRIVKGGLLTGVDLKGAEKALSRAARATFDPPDWVSPARAATARESRRG